MLSLFLKVIVSSQILVKIVPGLALLQDSTPVTPWGSSSRSQSASPPPRAPPLPPCSGLRSKSSSLSTSLLKFVKILIEFSKTKAPYTLCFLRICFWVFAFFTVLTLVGKVLPWFEVYFFTTKVSNEKWCENAKKTKNLNNFFVMYNKPKIQKYFCCHP